MNNKVKTMAIYAAYGVLTGLSYTCDALCWLFGKTAVATNKLRGKLALKLTRPNDETSLPEEEAMESADWESLEVSPPVDKAEARCFAEYTGKNTAYTDNSGADKPNSAKVTAVVSGSNQHPEINDQDKPTAA